MTSHDVVSRARRILGIKKIGHAGTLDPMASGVLLLAVGEATKTIQYAMNKDKTYRCTVKFGEATDTDDAEGAIITTSEHIPT